MKNFTKPIGDSFKILQGYTMQHKENAPGYSLITFTKLIENVVIGIDLKVHDDSTTELSNEYVYEIYDDEIED